MILFDTHVWIWWVQADSRLSTDVLKGLDREADGGIAVHIMSCWEVGMLCAKGRLELPCGLQDWMDQALSYPGVELVSLTPTAAIESCVLPGDLPGDPVDRILVAASRELRCPLISADKKLLGYEHADICDPQSFAK